MQFTRALRRLCIHAKLAGDGPLGEESLRMDEAKNIHDFHKKSRMDSIWIGKENA